MDSSSSEEDFLLLETRILKICLILCALRICQTKHGYDSETTESRDVESVSASYFYASNRLQLDLTGSLRRYFVYHAGLRDERQSVICSPLSALLPLGKLAMGTSSRRYDEFRQVLGVRRSKIFSETRGLFNNIIRPSQISRHTSLIITNVVYFNGQWKDEFRDPHSTSFYTPSGERTVTMMSRHGQYKYVNSGRLRSQIIEIPYSSKDVSFIIVLPNTNDGLPHLLRNLLRSPESLNHELSSMRKQSVGLYIPKFKVASDFDLSELYANVGMREIFKANNKVLTKVLNDDSVFVSRAIHAAVIMVDEYGTEAAGVSTLQVEVTSAAKSIEFKANHPFLFFVMAKGEQLFGGTYTGL